MNNKKMRKRYFRQLQFPGGRGSEAHKAALDRAHELRKLEIENYWKRSSYFWGFQLVAFAALTFSINNGHVNTQLVLIVSVLGALAAWTGVLTAKGSKFWQANWEAHVDFLEPEFEGNLHMTALVNKRLEYSVSRVNERFMQVLFTGWIIIFAADAILLIWPGLFDAVPAHALSVEIGLPVIAFSLGMWGLMHNTKSQLRGRAFKRQTMEEVGDT